MARISEVAPDWITGGEQVFLEYQDSGPQGWYGRSWSRVRSRIRNPGRVSELKQVSPVEALLLKLVTRSRLREHLDSRDGTVVGPTVVGPMAPRYYYPRRTGGGASTKGPVLRGYEPVAPWHTTATTERMITRNLVAFATFIMASRIRPAPPAEPIFAWPREAVTNLAFGALYWTR